MNSEKKLASPVMKRMPIYYRCLSNLLQIGISRISSKDLGNMLGSNSSQVRQDFTYFNANGLQGYGYDVELLHSEIHKLLGLNTMKSMIIIGAGSLGQALAKHTNFERKGFKLIGLFDVNKQIIGKRIRDIEIRHLDSLHEFVKSNTVDIAAITVPESYANEVVLMVTNLGITGLWNFAPVELKIQEGAVVENIHLVDSLVLLGYKLLESKAIKTSKIYNDNI